MGRKSHRGGGACAGDVGGAERSRSGSAIAYRYHVVGNPQFGRLVIGTLGSGWWLCPPVQDLLEVRRRGFEVVLLGGQPRPRYHRGDRQSGRLLGILGTAVRLGDFRVRSRKVLPFVCVGTESWRWSS